jgi:hypothetical protein
LVFSFVSLILLALVVIVVSTSAATLARAAALPASSTWILFDTHNEKIVWIDQQGVSSIPWRTDDQLVGLRAVTDVLGVAWGPVQPDQTKQFPILLRWENQWAVIGIDGDIAVAVVRRPDGSTGGIWSRSRVVGADIQLSPGNVVCLLGELGMNIIPIGMMWVIFP